MNFYLISLAAVVLFLWMGGRNGVLAAAAVVVLTALAHVLTKAGVYRRK